MIIWLLYFTYKSTQVFCVRIYLVKKVAYSALHWWRLGQHKLDGISMYRTVTLALLFLVGCSLFLGSVGALPYRASEQLIALIVAVATALLLNLIFSKLWHVDANHESALITGLILFFLILPPQLTAVGEVWQLAAVVALAIASKYIFVWRKQHLFNPAAMGLVLLALLYEVLPIPGFFESTWWIGQRELFIPLLIAGVVVVAKVRKKIPILTFLTVAFVVYLIEDWRFFGTITDETVVRFWFSGPSLFLAFFMLTEPFTMPPRKGLQVGYAAVVAIFSQTTAFLTVGIKMTPELALVLGNLLFYPSTLKQKLILPLVAVREVAKETFVFTFNKPARMRFWAGQYLEWMLSHEAPDNRGSRRYLTISSAPANPLLSFTVRIGERTSTYKQALRKMKIGDKIIASQLAGDFLLPTLPDKKIAMIAGGIGVTPFISQIEQMQMSSDVPKLDTILFYCNNFASEIAYEDWLEKSTQTLPLKIIPVLAKEKIPLYEYGFLTAEIIKKHAPDYLERVWYISGPPMMVDAYTKLLRDLGVKNIKKDFFPGLA